MLGRDPELDVAHGARHRVGHGARLRHPREHGVDQLRAVDRDVQRLAHALVADGCVGPRQDPPEVHVSVLALRDDRHAAPLQLLHPLAADLHDVDLAATKHREARRFLGHDLERQDPVLRGARAPVCGDGLELDVRAGHLLPNRYGPLPTGPRANTSSPFASMYFLGTIIPSVASPRDRYCGMISVGSLVTITTRSAAGVSMSLMSTRSGSA